MISRLLVSLLSISIWACGGTGIPDCTGHSLGYYCVSKTKFYWCYGNAAPSAKYCTDGLECKCGFTTDNPCVALLHFALVSRNRLNVPRGERHLRRSILLVFLPGRW